MPPSCGHYGKPDQLVRVWEKRGRLPKGRVSWADFADWQAQNRAFTAIAAYQSGDHNLTGDAGPEQVQGASLSANIFSLLQVSPKFGRSFLAADEKPGAPRVVILSHNLWQRRFGADPGLLGKSIHIDDAPVDVVGIMPPEFCFPDRKIELWMPMAIAPSSRMAGRGMHILDVIGRLRPDAGIEKARVDVASLTALLEKAYPRDNTGHSADASLLQDDWTSSYLTSLILIFGAVAFVLVIACANVATLLLSRATERRREVAMRCALGAGRKQIVRQLFIESLLLALVSALAGLALAHWLVQAIILVTPASVTRIGESGLTLPSWRLPCCSRWALEFSLGSLPLYTYRARPRPAR
jgi:putative ABC transport system permease protein